jgi:hypothetical protein
LYNYIWCWWRIIIDYKYGSHFVEPWFVISALVWATFEGHRDRLIVFSMILFYGSHLFEGQGKWVYV